MTENQRAAIGTLAAWAAAQQARETVNELRELFLKGGAPWIPTHRSAGAR